MQYVEDILEFVRTYLEDDSIDTELMVFINMAIDQASGIRNWDGLTGIKTITVSDGIMTVPPRMKKLRKVFADYSGNIPSYEFVPLNGDRIKTEGYLYQHSMEPYIATETAGLETTVTTTAGSQTISKYSTEDFLTADHVGKSVLITGSTIEYEVVSVDTGADTAVLFPAVDVAGDISVIVDPVGTPRLKLLDNFLTLYSGDVEVRYTKKHPKVTAATDLLYIPCPRFIAFTALSYGLEKNKYSVDSDRLARDLQEARVDEINLDTTGKSHSGNKSTLFSVRGRRLNRA